MINYCIDCTYFTKFPGTICRHPNNKSEPDLVFGISVSKNSPAELRAAPDKCGPEAKWFKEIEART